jgi:hypothetical protein
MFCGNCGHEMALEDKFCEKCGALVPVSIPPSKPAIVPKSGNLFSNKKLVIGAIAGLVLILFLVWINNRSTSVDGRAYSGKLGDNYNPPATEARKPSYIAGYFDGFLTGCKEGGFDCSPVENYLQQQLSPSTNSNIQ